MKKSLSFIGLASLTFSLTLLDADPTFAIGIRPVREEVSLPPGESTTGEITVLNETTEDFMAEPVIKVFYQTDESGIPVYANEDTLKIEDVRSWLDIPLEPIEVPASDSVVIPYTLTIPENAEAGGRYMSIAYQPVKEAIEGVSVNVRAASLLLINVEGDVIKSGEISDFTLPEELLSDQPLTFNVAFNNTGNTHVKPTGWIQIVDRKTNEPLKEIANYNDPITGQTITSDQLPINLTEGNVLPDNTRVFKGEWSQNIKEGDLKAVLKLVYDQKAEPLTKEMEFSIKENMALVGDLTMNTEGDKAYFEFTLKNEGNVHEKVSGSISISNTLAYKIDEISLPPQEGYLAPGESQTYRLDWVESAKIPEGRYTATLELPQALTGKNLSTELSFGEVNRTTLYLTGALVLVILTAIIIIFRKRKQQG